jgi:AraC-like DNA-binding protein
MRWSLSEFLNLVELRSQTWCFVELDSGSGLKAPTNDAIYFYAVLEGAAHVAGIAGRSTELRAGDILMVLSGEAHAVRSRAGGTSENLDFLTTGAYADSPPTFSIGDGMRATRVLAGRLKVRWPGGQHPLAIPPILRMRADEGLVNFGQLLRECPGRGGTAILTRAATLLFVETFRGDPECRAAFQEFNSQDPVARARQYVQTHPFTPWTVGILARKVGMGRSNFATRFAREVGRTPMEFLADERMKHAAIFLEKTDMKIAEVAERVGYRSEAAFIRRFSTCFGITPGELRKRVRRPNPVEGVSTSEPASLQHH